jgi:hypothetical protein
MLPVTGGNFNWTDSCSKFIPSKCQDNKLLLMENNREKETEQESRQIMQA